MRALAAAIAEVVVAEFGPAEFLRRLSDPVWFQAFGAALGVDWPSSGLTTLAAAPCKEGTADRQGDLGLFFAGGKGAASRRTPAEIHAAGERHALPAPLLALERASRPAAKVDSAAVQDGFTGYHHFFAFDRAGRWAVVQQGLRDDLGTARRYHWLGEDVADFTCEPHAAVAGPAADAPVLNMVAGGSAAARAASLEVTPPTHGGGAGRPGGAARARGACRGPRARRAPPAPDAALRAGPAGAHPGPGPTARHPGRRPDRRRAHAAL